MYKMKVSGERQRSIIATSQSQEKTNEVQKTDITSCQLKLPEKETGYNGYFISLFQLIPRHTIVINVASV